MKRRLGFGGSVWWAGALLSLATALDAHGESKEKVGQGALDRRYLKNYESVLDLSLEELTGESSHLRFWLNMLGDARVEAQVARSSSLTFGIGGLDLLAVGELDPGFRAMAEVLFEPQLTEIIIDVERLHVGWGTEHFFVNAGRFHTDLGYWGMAFRHGVWIYPSIERPQGVRFEDDGGLVPQHAVGVEVGGNWGIGPGSLHLIASVANGRGDAMGDVLLLRDTNLAKQLTISAYSQNLGLANLRLGAGAMFDWIAPAPATVRPALPNTVIRELTLNANIVYAGPRLNVLLEWYSVGHRAGSALWQSHAPYALVSYRFGRATPYLMLELLLHEGGDDPYFNPDGSIPSTSANFARSTAGVRFDASTWSALKLEYRFKRVFATEPNEHTVALNWSFGI